MTLHSINFVRRGLPCSTPLNILSRVTLAKCEPLICEVKFVNFHRHKVKEIVSTRISEPMQYMYSIYATYMQKKNTSQFCSRWMVRVSIYTSFMTFLNGGTLQWRRNMASATCSYYHWLLLLLYPTTPLTSCTQANENKQDVVLKIL